MEIKIPIIAISKDTLIMAVKTNKKQVRVTYPIKRSKYNPGMKLNWCYIRICTQNLSTNKPSQKGNI